MMEQEDIKLPIGTDYPILEKIRLARLLFEAYGEELQGDRNVSSLIASYRSAIRETWEQMDKSGVIEHCTDCAVRDGGSCCGKGIEDRFDTALILINLLMGSRIPDSREDDAGCWFLGREGCLIVAREVICVNYICKKLYRKISWPDMQVLQAKIMQETDAAFMLDATVKSWLAGRLDPG
ncbi:MAG TPA: hypothetical protein EYP57_06870 [Thermodesulfobacteriaceae bacterium]|nr:hypothetical protein [Thermodesulfobacteriaceae bacterium]